MEEIIGVLIVAALMIMWAVMDLLRGRQRSNDASIDSGIYLDDFVLASTRLGIIVDKDDIQSKPKFLSSLLSMKDLVNPYEAALHNALTVFMKSHVAEPKPYPNDLHLTIATAAGWVDKGIIDSAFLKGLLTTAEAELNEQGLGLTPPSEQPIASAFIQLSDIRKATSRCSYTASELDMLVNYLEGNHRKGLDTALSALCNEDTAKDGILIISSPDQLGTDILLVKLNAGKGLFGGQKATYGFYLGMVRYDFYQPGATYKSFPVALTSINNIYRATGQL